ncbi:MAG: hypothetical protein M3139_10110 [Bacteroidota bacterium]|nr:hypothetical protein [Bacteroidota bacterium]
MANQFFIVCVSLFISVKANAQILKGNLSDKNDSQQGNILAYNEMQLINKYNIALNFKYSYDKQNWELLELKKNDYIVVKFTVEQNYFYIRLCTDVSGSRTANCDDYRLQRQQRYLFKWNKDTNSYTIGVLKDN